VRESLQFECSPAPDRVRIAEQYLERYYDRLPAELLLPVFSRQFGRRAAVHASGHLLQPAMQNIFVPQGSRISVLFKPSGVSNETLWERALQPV
jgi:hypothetical protein